MGESYSTSSNAKLSVPVMASNYPTSIARLDAICQKIDQINERLRPVLLSQDMAAKNPTAAPRAVESDLLGLIDSVYFRLTMLEERISL